MMPVTPTFERENMFDNVRTVGAGSDTENSMPSTPEQKPTGE